MKIIICIELFNPGTFGTIGHFNSLKYTVNYSFFVYNRYVLLPKFSFPAWKIVFVRRLNLLLLHISCFLVRLVRAGKLIARIYLILAKFRQI